MRFKFKPQTGILVAGLLAATYAEACYYQQTDGVCVTAGTTVDKIIWQDGNSGGTSQFVTASSDWIVYAQPGHYLVGTGSGSYGNYGSDGGSLPMYCNGAVHFKDGSGNTASVSSWYGGSITASYLIFTPAHGGVFAGTGNGTCS